MKFKQSVRGGETELWGQSLSIRRTPGNFENLHPTRWTTSLSSKVNFPDEINMQEVFGVGMVT